MKYLVLFAVLYIAYLVWRNGRVQRHRHEPPARPAGPQEMVSCPVCGVHLPKPEAVRGGDGRLYCSNEHRLRNGG